MSREYEGNPVAKCMNARKGDCFGINCPCEDYRPTYLMSKEDVETIMPGARDRSINPGAIRYKSKHTRMAGEHRYPREDIIVDTYGNKRIGGYDDHIGKADVSEKDAAMRKLFSKYPKVRLLCANCDAGKLFSIENVCSRDRFVYACPKCHSRNGLDVSTLIGKLKTEDVILDSYFTYKCKEIPVDNSSSFKSLAVDYMLKEAFSILDDPYKDLHVSKDQVAIINDLEATCVFHVKKAGLCVFDGKPRENRCSGKCKNCKMINFLSMLADAQLTEEIWPVYQKLLKELRLKSEAYERQIKGINKQLSGGTIIDEEGCDLASLKQTLKQELKVLEKQRTRIKAKWNSLLDTNEEVKTHIRKYANK